MTYAVAIFLGSALLFLLEPIAGKRLLPLLGGSAAVWTACLVFFQAALLLGYLTAHWLVTRTRPRTQALVYVGMLALSVVQLATTVHADLRASPAHPIASVFWLLTLIIGLPFVTLSITSPMLQAWYARPGAGGGQQTLSTRRPYRLYAVSNVGSLLGLLVYPWLVEPHLSLGEQGTTLIVGVALLAGVAAIIAWGSFAALDDSGEGGAGAALARRPDGAPIPEVRVAAYDSVGRRVLWVLLAACGSLLLSAVTNRLSENVATIPLLWIIPLIAYLLSFVVAFSERWQPRPVVTALAVVGLAAAAWRLYRGDLAVAVPVAIGIYCGALFVLCLFCHSELYRRRPTAERLTSFYFHVAAGGALGAMLVGIAAPLLLPGDYELALALCAVTALGLAVFWQQGDFVRALGISAVLATAALVAAQVHADHRDRLFQIRNFYGTLHVTQAVESDYHATVRTLYHGLIEHGEQVYRGDLVHAPTTYYGRGSGIGLALDACCGTRARRIGVIGLGTGTIAAYGRPGDVIRFYDINPAVEPIARRYFTYLHDSPARIDVVPGDARVSLSDEPPQRFDVIAVDAFTGDAIPVHLITSEALALYERQLRPGGIVAFHVSNRFLDLAPVVQQLADHARLQTVWVSNDDDTPTDVFASDWVLVTADSAFLRQPHVAKARQRITVPRGLRRWTDDYNSLLPILRMREHD